MQHKLSRILGKPNDYCVCTQCGVLNWYENEYCWNCGAPQYEEVNEEEVEDWDDVRTENFNCNEDAVLKWVRDEYDYWAEEGVSEDEADNILITI